MRRIFVSRSSLLKPKPLLRCVRTTSPSRISTLYCLQRSSSANNVDSVDLPAPDKPVNQIVNPGCSKTIDLLSEILCAGELLWSALPIAQIFADHVLRYGYTQ